MSNVLLIVPRANFELFESLHRLYSDAPSISVILDRRVHERRRHADDVRLDHRRGDRRRHDARAVGAQKYAIVST